MCLEMGYCDTVAIQLMRRTNGCFRIECYEEHDQKAVVYAECGFEMGEFLSERRIQESSGNS